MSLLVQSLALLSGLRIRHCHELWCRLQMRLGSRAAVALAEAGSYSSDWTPSLGTSMCHGSGPRKWQKDKKKKITRHENTRGQMQNTENDWKLRDQEPTTILYIERWPYQIQR